MALAAVPLVGIVELVMHVHQVRDVVHPSNWLAARGAVAKDLGPDDLVTFAPYWSDPLGRRTFGDEIMTMKRAARSDEARFARAWEISIRGARDETLEGWKKVDEQRYGDVTVRLLENPSPSHVIDDLLDFVDPQRMSVSRVDASGAETACVFQHGASAGGSTVVPQGLLVPAERFVCQGGGHAGISVLHGLDHHPHVCINATPVQGGALRLKFAGVTFGDSLVGHSGVQWIAERNPSQERTTVAFSAFGRPLGTHSHKLGAGWGGFELPTPEIKGKKGDLIADVGGSQQRYFCFEATTRNRGEAGGAR